MSFHYTQEKEEKEMRKLLIGMLVGVMAVVVAILVLRGGGSSTGAPPPVQRASVTSVSPFCPPMNGGSLVYNAGNPFVEYECGR